MTAPSPAAESSPQPPRRAALLAAFFVVYTVWGSTYLAIKMAVESLPPFVMAGTRFLVAGLLLYPIMRLITRHQPGLREWRAAALIGVLLMVGGNGLVCWAEQTMPSGAAALIIGTTPMWFVVVDWLVYSGNRPTLPIIAGMIVGLTGVGLLAKSTGNIDRPVSIFAVPALLAACASWAMGSVHAKRRPQPTPLLQFVAMQMITGGAAQLLTGGLLGEWSHIDPAHVTARSLMGLAYLIGVGSLMAFPTYVWLVRHAAPAAVSTYAYVNPLIAVMLGALLDREPVSPSMLTAMALILGAVVLITLIPRRLADEPQPEPLEPA